MQITEQRSRSREPVEDSGGDAAQKGKVNSPVDTGVGGLSLVLAVIFIFAVDVVFFAAVFIIGDVVEGNSERPIPKLFKYVFEIVTNLADFSLSVCLSFKTAYSVMTSNNKYFKCLLNDKQLN